MNCIPFHMRRSKKKPHPSPVNIAQQQTPDDGIEVETDFPVAFYLAQIGAANNRKNRRKVYSHQEHQNHQIHQR